MSDRQPPLDEDEARELLSRERERLERELAELGQLRRGELDEIDTATDPADDSEEIVDGQIDDAVAAQLKRQLEAVERAEKRLAEGTYGFSVESGEPIPAERLRAIPWAERTPEEQESYERTHGRAL